MRLLANFEGHSHSGFSFSNKVGVEELQTGGKINIKLFRNLKIVLQ